jgi:hypothetical protein
MGMMPHDSPVSMSAVRSERRIRPRVPCQFIIQYRSTQRADWDLSPLRELGSGGARFLADGELASGEAVDIRMGLPLFSEPVRLPARVVWQKSTFSGVFKVAETGIVFTQLDAHLLRTIDDAVQRILQQSREKPPHVRTAAS